MADIITVSALNKYVRSILESDPVLTDIAIRGEISNFNRNYKTGHCYFSLKDDKAGVKAVMFRSDAQELAFAPENGMQVVARGRISLYERDGAFQIYVDSLFMDGEGAAQQAFLQLKERLEREGLFDPTLKKPLPRWPRNIGLVTSKTGAALQDILHVSQRRYPLVRYTLAPVAVQGQQAVPGLVDAVERLGKMPGIDLIIVARGGGSAEDLWVFNSEDLARAVFACRVPVVSAIGHEIDFTILDFVADLRAPTPSAAAELALPDMEDIRRQIVNISMNIANKIHHQLDLCYNRLSYDAQRTSRLEPSKHLAKGEARLEQLAQQLRQAQKRRYGDCAARFKAAVSLAESLSPYGVLARGYGVVGREGAVVHSARRFKPGDNIQVTMRDGKIDGVVQAVTESEGNLP